MTRMKSEMAEMTGSFQAKRQALPRRRKKMTHEGETAKSIMESDRQDEKACRELISRKSEETGF